MNFQWTSCLYWAEHSGMYHSYRNMCCKIPARQLKEWYCTDSITKWHCGPNSARRPEFDTQCETHWNWNDSSVIFGLQVEPFASLAGAVRSSVPRLLINRDLVGPFAWNRRPLDVVQLGDVVSGVQALVDALGWKQELHSLMAADANSTGGWYTSLHM